LVGVVSAQHGPNVASAVEAAGTRASKDGFSSAIRETRWTVVGLLALSFLLAYLLPRKAADRGLGGADSWQQEPHPDTSVPA
jgi:hypothetical protein